MSTSSIVILVIVAVAIIVAIWAFAASQRAKRRKRFGPEYDRLVEESGSARRAHAELSDREKRVSRFEIRPLTQDECNRFIMEWRTIQERFVDEPKMSVWKADALVNRAMRTRGYPMGDFEQQAADISVEHPEVDQNYRVAHDIAVRDQQGRATTEELRRAMQLYRDLFEHIVDLHVARV